MATKDKQPDVKIYLRSDRPPEEPTEPLREEAQFPMVVGDVMDFVSDQDTAVRRYEMNEFSETGQSSLLEMNDDGEIESMVKPIIEGQEPVMMKKDERGMPLNPTMGMIMEHFADLSMKAQKDPSVTGQMKNIVSIPGQAIENAVGSTLKFFIKNTPDDFQNKFYDLGLDMERLGLVEKEGQPLGGLVGLTGSSKEFKERQFFSPEDNAWWEDIGVGFAQFYTGLKGVQMIANTKKLLAPSMAADALVFDPTDGGLFSMINQLDLDPGATQDFVEFMDSTKHDQNMGRAIQVAEGLMIGGLLGGSVLAIQNKEPIKQFIKKVFTPESYGRKAADPAIRKVAELLTEVKSKWPKNQKFEKYMDKFGRGWRKNMGNERGAVGKKPKVKKVSRTEETGTLNTIYPEINQGMEESMSRMDPAEAEFLRKNMEEHEFTPWAAATSRGLTIREFFHRAIEGRMDDALALANSKLWGKDSLVKYEMGKAFMHSKEAVLKFAGSYSFIGKNRKAELDMSGSFKNCNPSGDCAKFCYASIANARPSELMKAEFTEWVAENHPEMLAKRVGALYSATPQGMTGLALRINDKGDLSDGQVELIKAMNKQGHRIQIFSKRPDMLAKVPDFNLKMLSIDSTNFELSREHPDLQLAVTITDSMTPEMIAEVNERVAVYLPVNLKGGEVTRADVQKRFPDSFKKMTKKLCPVDGGKMKTKPGTSFVGIAMKTEPGLWTCTACDKFGAAGCFNGKNQTENVKKINNQNKQANK